MTKLSSIFKVVSNVASKSCQAFRYITDKYPERTAVVGTVVAIGGLAGIAYTIGQKPVLRVHEFALRLATIAGATAIFGAIGVTGIAKYHSNTRFKERALSAISRRPHIVGEGKLDPKVWMADRGPFTVNEMAKVVMDDIRRYASEARDKKYVTCGEIARLFSLDTHENDERTGWHPEDLYHNTDLYVAFDSDTTGAFSIVQFRNYEMIEE